MLKILHLDENHELLKNELSNLGFENCFDFDSSKKEIENKLEKYHGIILRSRITIDNIFLDKGINLKFIARVGSGTENIDIVHAKKRHIKILSAGEANANAVGEHALGMILSLKNRILNSNNEIKKVALCGGSGRFLLNAAKQSGADIFITSDFKYHEFFDAENRILIADIGHYESEQFTMDLIVGFLRKNFPKFAIHLSKVNTNPINYL